MPLGIASRRSGPWNQNNTHIVLTVEVDLLTGPEESGVMAPDTFGSTGPEPYAIDVFFFSLQFWFL